MPGGIPTDIHLVCADHPAWEHDGSHTSLWQHITAEHTAASPTLTVSAPSVSYPPA